MRRSVSFRLHVDVGARQNAFRFGRNPLGVGSDHHGGRGAAGRAHRIEHVRHQRAPADLMELYDRFGCPPSHIQAAFRCIVRVGDPDPKSSESLSARVHACWINPATEVSLPAAAAAPSPTTNR